MNLRSEGVIDSLSLITYLPLRIAKGEMDGNNVVTYMMQESNYNGARKQLQRCKEAIITMQGSYYKDCVTFVM